MVWNLPNILTVLRLLAAPALAVLFLYFSRPLADYIAIFLFLGASITDFFDGYLARAWKQETKFGRMLDPIADKAMVLVALMVVVSISGLDPWLLLPAALIAFREVFVSGLREFLGADASKLQVTKLAKWKTTVQMIAIAVLFSKGVFENYYFGHIVGMDPNLIDAILSGQAEDVIGLNRYKALNEWSLYLGRILLWVAAIMTLISGWDYFRKALPFLKETK